MQHVQTFFCMLTLLASLKPHAQVHLAQLKLRHRAVLTVDSLKLQMGLNLPKQPAPNWRSTKWITPTDWPGRMKLKERKSWMLAPTAIFFKNARPLYSINDPVKNWFQKKCQIKGSHAGFHILGNALCSGLIFYGSDQTVIE